MYVKDENLMWVATAKEPVYMNPQMANRHGLVAGATGTGKTVSIKVLAEAFSDMGVPVFMADIKGDVSGMCQEGTPNKHVDERVQSMNIANFKYQAYPARFFDVFGEKGIPVRTRISDMGPDLLSRILELNDTQEGVLNLIFKIADDNGLLLIDLKDLRAMVQYAGEHSKEYQSTYGNISSASIGAIQRSLLTLETSGGSIFFGEPELDIKDWITTDADGRGFINILDCVKLVQSPLLYSTFLLWMLSEVYEMLPEEGDLEKPKMIFFFDEAHLLFDDASKALLQKIEQVARLIRSKGVGIYFITQSPSDIPDSVLSQLGNKIQHALRAYTPKDQKAVKSAAASFRANPDFDSEQTLGELETGEALISLLDEKGAPQIVQRAFMLPPQSSMNIADSALVQQNIASCPLTAKYGTAIDNKSAYEMIQENAKTQEQEAQQKALDEKQNMEQDEKAKQWETEQKAKQKELEKKQKELEKQEKEQEKLEAQLAKEKAKKASAVGKVVTSTLNSVGREFGRNLIRGLFGNLKK